MNELDLLEGDPFFERLLLADLGEAAQALLDRILQLETGPALLWLLCTRPRTSMTADDVAFQLGASPQVVERDLKSFLRLGIVRTTRVSDFTIYSLTYDPERRRLVHELGAWHDRWEARLSKIRHIVWGQGEETREADSPLHRFSD